MFIDGHGAVEYNPAMFEKLYAYIVDKAYFIHATYGIDSRVFLIMTIVLTGPYYYSIYRLIRSITSRTKKEFVFWGTIFLLLTAAPYVYILMWGHNLPWYIFAIIVFLVLNGLYALIQKVRKRQSGKKSRVNRDNTDNTS